MPAKMKRIGWIIEARKTKRHKWRNLYMRDYFKSKKDAKKMFRYFNDSDSFKKQENDGLVRLSRVYREATNGRN